MSNYDELANKIIRDFIKAVVLIDDHWQEAKDAPTTDVAPEQINTFLTPIPLQPNTDLAIQEVAPCAGSNTDLVPITNPAYLREIGQEITNQGFLFTGFAYTDEKKETAYNLASKSDVLILDWYLGSADSRPALDLLDKLKSSGSPRFVFILTDQSLENVRTQVGDRLGEIEGSGFVFGCGLFSFSLMNKPQAGGENVVVSTAVLNIAIEGIKKRFGGLLQLAALQLLSRYKRTLHEALVHFKKELDAPFIMEWFEKDSPIGPSSSFRDLMIDEWRSLVEKTASSCESILSDTGLSAYIASKVNEPSWGGTSATRVYDLLEKQRTCFPSSGSKLDELEEEIRAWMNNSRGNLPSLTKPNGVTWTSENVRTIAWGYLSIALGNPQQHREQLISLDAFFHSQTALPTHLSQGTVLKRKTGGQYLICITPSCDCTRPDTRIAFQYSFLRAERVPTGAPINADAGAVVAIRTKDEGSFLLRVILKPSVCFQVKDGSLANDLNLLNPFSSKQCFRAVSAAQLRPTRVQSLVALTAGMAIEVGLDRSELLRLLCNKKKT